MDKKDRLVKLPDNSYRKILHENKTRYLLEDQDGPIWYLKKDVKIVENGIKI